MTLTTSTSIPKASNNDNGAQLHIRLMAILYDTFLILAMSMAYGAIATFIAAQINGATEHDYNPTVSGPIFQAGWGITLLVFYCYFWIKAGQTVGMKAWRLKLITTNTKSLTITQCIMRFFIGILSFSCFGLGFLWVLIDKNNDTLHDRICNTRMIRTNKLPKKTKT